VAPGPPRPAGGGGVDSRAHREGGAHLVAVDALAVESLLLEVDVVAAAV